MADNAGTIEDPDEADEYPDWIELYNYGSTAIDVGGMYLKDDSTTWRIPSNAPAQTTIQPGGYLLFWADDDTEPATAAVGPALSQVTGPALPPGAALPASVGTPVSAP